MSARDKSKRRLSRGQEQYGKGPVAGAQYWPGAMVLLASFISLWPLISERGWWPDMALLVLIAWRLQRPLAFPNWFAPVAGLFNDLIAGHTIGLSVFIFSLAMIFAELLERRRQWSDWFGEWVVAATLITVAEIVQWQVARLEGAAIPFHRLDAPLIVAILAYPIVSNIVAWVDLKRVRR